MARAFSQEHQAREVAAHNRCDQSIQRAILLCKALSEGMAAMGTWANRLPKPLSKLLADRQTGTRAVCIV